MFNWFKKERVVMPLCCVCCLKATHKIIINRQVSKMDGELISISSNESLYCNHCWKEENIKGDE